MTKFLTIAAACTVLTLQTGCSHITMLRTEELRRIQDRVDSLRTQMTAAQEQIISVQQKQTEMLRLIRADQQVRFGEIERSVSALTGSISESQYRLTKIDEKTQKITEQWQEKARADSLVEAARTAEVDNLFEIAHKDFVAGRHEIALGGFRDLIGRFPESRRADDASYWVAECYYAQKAFGDAEKSYKEYLKNYPEGGSRCVALFKLGLTYDKLRQEKRQELVWKSLLEKCPDSEEAAAVKARRGW